MLSGPRRRFRGCVQEFAKLIHGRPESGQRRRREVVVALGQILFDAIRANLVEHTEMVERGRVVLVRGLVEPVLRAHVIADHADTLGIHHAERVL